MLSPRRATLGFTLAEDQKRCIWLVGTLDPLILHTSPPCTSHSSLAPRPAQPNFDAEARGEADGLIEFSIQLLERRAQVSAGGSFESPKAASTWSMDSVKQFFGLRTAPKPGRFFADPDLCQYGLAEPGDPEGYWKKSIVLAATYEEILLVNQHCAKVKGKPMRKHVRVRGTCQVPAEHEDEHTNLSASASEPLPLQRPKVKWKDRSALSAWYPLALGLAWGRAIAKACFRLCADSADKWAAAELERSRQDPEASGRVSLQVQLERRRVPSLCGSPASP